MIKIEQDQVPELQLQTFMTPFVKMTIFDWIISIKSITYVCVNNVINIIIIVLFES